MDDYTKSPTNAVLVFTWHGPYRPGRAGFCCLAAQPRSFERACHDQGPRSYAQDVTRLSIPTAQAMLPPARLFDLLL